MSFENRSRKMSEPNLQSPKLLDEAARLLSDDPATKAQPAKKQEGATPNPKAREEMQRALDRWRWTPRLEFDHAPVKSGVLENWWKEDKDESIKKVRKSSV